MCLCSEPPCHVSMTREQDAWGRSCTHMQLKFLKGYTGQKMKLSRTAHSPVRDILLTPSVSWMSGDSAFTRWCLYSWLSSQDRFCAVGETLDWVPQVDSRRSSPHKGSSLIKGWRNPASFFSSLVSAKFSIHVCMSKRRNKQNAVFGSSMVELNTSSKPKKYIQILVLWN